MSSSSKQPPVKRWRILAGGTPCYIDKRFDEKELGVPLPCSPGCLSMTTIFRSKQKAEKSIIRLYELRERINGSMLRDWDKFKPLFYVAVPEVQEIHLTAEELDKVSPGTEEAGDE